MKRKALLAFMSITLFLASGCASYPLNESPPGLDSLERQDTPSSDINEE